jgi:DNA-binding CsgD family transcriptional regulator
VIAETRGSAPGRRNNVAGSTITRDYVGEILRISPRTVKKHLEQIFTKFGVENRASAAARAVKILAAGT